MFLIRFILCPFDVENAENQNPGSVAIVYTAAIRLIPSRAWSGIELAGWHDTAPHRAPSEADMLSPARPKVEYDKRPGLGSLRSRPYELDAILVRRCGLGRTAVRTDVRRVDRPIGQKNLSASPVGPDTTESAVRLARNHPVESVVRKLILHRTEPGRVVVADLMLIQQSMGSRERREADVLIDGLRGVRQAIVIVNVD